MNCGGHSYKVIVDMPNEAVENDAYAWLHPSSGAPGNLTIRVTEIEKSDEYGNRIEKTKDATLPPEGLKHDLRLNNDRDERDRELDYKFEVVGASNWAVHKDDIHERCRAC